MILALNNSTLYPGIAAGSAVGGVALQFAPVSLLGWVGAAFVALALAALFLSIRVDTGSRQERSAEPMASSRV